MNPLSECLDESRVESLLQGRLDPHQYQSAQDHLEGCERCRSRIEAAIGPQRWWHDVRNVLRASNAALREESHPNCGELLNDLVTGGPHRTDVILNLLGPTDEPSMLGRIGPYEIIGLLGQGGMGAVFKGFDRSLNRFVAIKMLLPHLAASATARKRFAREAQAVAAVVDDHVMAIHGVDQWQGAPYLVMPYSRGATLQRRLTDEGLLEVREILRIGMQAAKGLAAAHAQGIVHRDVKPANIFLDQNVERVQLMDFGLARAVDDASLTRTGVLAGTPQYMSPEQARAETVDHRSDLFSLGSVMYAMCTGHAPFRAESSYGVLRLITDSVPPPIREINPDIPEWLGAIISKLMHKQANCRFDSAAEVAQILEACLAHVQQPTCRPLPQIVLQLSQLPASVAGTEVTAKSLSQFFAAPVPTAKLIAAGIALMLCIGAAWILFPTSTRNLSVARDADQVQIRVLKGEDTVERFTFNTANSLTRLQAGDYTIEIDGADAERQARCEAGGEFLDNARIDQWENVFSEGIQKMGKIVVTMNGEVATEAWFEDGYHLFRKYESGTRQLVQLWNREYAAMLDVRGNQIQTRGTFLPPSAGNINIHALPFAICSSVDFTNELIPRSLKSGKLRIYDYQVDGSRHILDLEHSAETKEGGFIQLVFDETVDDLLPTEAIFHQGTPYARHFINTDFAEVAGFNVPLRVVEVNTADRVVTQVFPEEPLDKKMCRLSHYGLPEPDGLAVTDFGRNSVPWGRGIFAAVAILLAGTIGIWLWRQNGRTR